MTDPLIINRENLTVWCRVDCHAQCQRERGKPGIAEGPQGGVVFACRCDCHRQWQTTELVALLQTAPQDGPVDARGAPDFQEQARAIAHGFTGCGSLAAVHRAQHSQACSELTRLIATAFEKAYERGLADGRKSHQDA